jgi:hypothetical protein
VGDLGGGVSHDPGAEDPFGPRRSPDGGIEVRFDAYEVRMSHWIREPTVIRTRDGAAILSLSGTSWDGAGVPPTFPSPGRVELHLRHYPDGSNLFDLVVDTETGRCWPAGAEDESCDAADAGKLLDPAREGAIAQGAQDLLAQGFCPDCQSQLYGGFLTRLRGRVTCLVGGRTWKLPPGARLY